MLKQSFIGKGVQDVLSRVLSGIPLSPNAITVLAIVFSAVGMVNLLMWEFWLAFALFLLAGICDIADGAVARARNQMTKKGAFLDGITDRIVEFLLISGLMFYRWPNFVVLPGFYWLAILLFFGSAMTTYIPAYAFLKGVAKAEDAPGVFARPERMSLLLFIILMLALGKIDFALVALVFGALLSIGTAFTRFVYFWISKVD